MEQKQIQQKAFDLALDHIRKQGKPSMDDGGVCKYDNGSGLSCAFRPMIKDYDSEMEGEAARDLITSFSSNLKDWARELDNKFADSLQDCHDESTIGDKFIPAFELNMKSLAKKYELEYKPETK